MTSTFTPDEIKLMSKKFCVGSGQSADTLEHRRTSGSTFVKCPECGRILKPTTASNLLRRHQPRNKATTSLDATRDSLWAYAVSTERKGHFALGLRVMVRFGAKPVGWGDEPFVGNNSDGWDEDEYDQWYSINDVSEGSFAVAGWYWEPEDLVVP